MQGHNSPQIAAAFRRFWRVTSGETIPTQLGDVVQPTMEMGQLNRSPYWRQTFTGELTSGVAGVALEFGYAVAVPGAGRILRVVKIDIENPAATEFTGRLAWLSAANQTTVGLTAGTAFRDFNSGLLETVAATISSRMRLGTHTAVVTTATDRTIRIPALGNKVIDYSQVLGPCVWDDGINAPPGFALINETAAEALTATWTIEEWPIVPLN